MIPANQTSQQDLDSAVQNVFQHASTPAYISRQLIQRLVTGNPSPAFIGRISAVFKDNGQGVRGDLKAVVKAILLDSEARDVATPSADFGSLREPSVAVTAAIRALNSVAANVFNPASIAPAPSPATIASVTIISQAGAIA